MSDEQRQVFEPEIIDDYDATSPVAPQDVASAARSCQAIILILLALAAIACVVLVVALAS